MKDFKIIQKIIQTRSSPHQTKEKHSIWRWSKRKLSQKRTEILVSNKSNKVEPYRKKQSLYWGVLRKEGTSWQEADMQKVTNYPDPKSTRKQFQGQQKRKITTKIQSKPTWVNIVVQGLKNKRTIFQRSGFWDVQ